MSLKKKNSNNNYRIHNMRQEFYIKFLAYFSRSVTGIFSQWLGKQHHETTATIMVHLNKRRDISEPLPASELELLSEVNIRISPIWTRLHMREVEVSEAVTISHPKTRCVSLPSLTTAADPNLQHFLTPLSWKLSSTRPHHTPAWRLNSLSWSMRCVNWDIIIC